MPLVESALKSDIKSALEAGMSAAEESGAPPKILSSVAKALAAAYDSYASKGMAGVLLPTTPGPSSIETAFASEKLAEVGTALMSSYWTSVMWAGPGFGPGTTIPAGMAGLGPDIAAMFDPAPDSLDAFAGKLAGALNKYTGMLMVSATSVAGVPGMFPVA
jgi:hypothetical protein